MNDKPKVTLVLSKFALSETSEKALLEVCIRENLSKTDALNRGIQLYEYVLNNPVYVKTSSTRWYGLVTRFHKLALKGSDEYGD